MTWADQLGTDLNDKGAAVALDGAGNLTSPASRTAASGRTSASFDVVLVKYAAGHEPPVGAAVRDDRGRRGRRFAEANLYLATGGSSIYVSGLSAGDTESSVSAGLGDVFLAKFDALGVNG